MPELLAPAGSLDALKAAVCAGADAVYLGGASFGARAAVGFSPDDLREALRFAHFHDRKVYVTVNTLVKDSEWEELRKSLDFLSNLHVDAVLVQDLGALSLCRTEFPGLTLHASTQMSLHTPSGILWAKQNGIRRVVLNREATLEDIRNAVSTGVEIEVFAHGALCVSVSGQCALSASLGERSGNRGRCGQPCRLPYQYRGEERAWLSPADLCTLPYLKELRDAGVASLKLEGRLKRPEYVYTVTDIYRRALDELEGRGPGTDTSSEMDALRQIFCRGRFTPGYAGQEQDAGILNPEHTAHEGILMGKLEQISRRGDAILGRFVPRYDLHDQDGLTVDEDKCIYTGPDIPAGRQATLRLHRPAEVGAPVHRTESAEQLAKARTMYGNEALKRLDRPFDAVFTAYEGKPAILTLDSNGVRVHIEGPVCEKAERQPLSESSIKQAISKTGDTPFYLADLKSDVRNAYLSSAQLNAMRREALSDLKTAVIEQHERPADSFFPEAVVHSEPYDRTPPAGRIFVRTENPEEIQALLEAGADHVLLSLPDVTPDAIGRLPDMSCVAKRVSLLFPRLASDAVLSRLSCYARDSDLELAADNAGQLSSAPEIRMAAEGVPVFNHNTECFLSKQGIRAAILSPELSGSEIAVMPAPTLERILCVYGRQQLMLLRHCPERVYRGLNAGHADCRLCDTGNGLKGQFLTDRKGMRLPLIPYRTDDGCVVRLYSAKPLSLLGHMADLRRLPLSFLLSFTDEPAEKRLSILKAFKYGASCDINGTAGKYLTGVL